MDVKKLTVAFGLVVTTTLWETFGNKGVGYVSNKIHEIGKTLDAKSSYTDWFKPDYIVGVTLASQIFITACGNHSPVINFAERSVIGLVYYTPTVLIYEGAKIFLQSFNSVSIDLVKPTAGVVSVFGGGMVGGFCQNHIGQPLDKVASYIDFVAKSTGFIVIGTYNQLIGNARAKSAEEHFTPNLEIASFDTANVETLLGGENQLYNTTIDNV